MELYFKSTSKHPLLDLEFYAYSVGSYHYNWHNQVELMLVLQGELELNSNGVVHQLKEDDVIWINPREGHTTFAQTQHTVAFVTHFNMEMMTTLANTPNHLQVAFAAKEDHSPLSGEIRRSLAHMMLALESEGLSRELRIIAALYQVLSLIGGESSALVEKPQSRFRSAKEDPIKKIVLYIDKHYMESITLEDLGRVGGYNANYVSQMFRKHLGLTFYDYLTRIRLRHALIDLRESDMSILEVAARNGFADVRSFNHYFKQRFAKTPLAYKKSISSHHKEIDRAFKRNFIERDAPVILKKVAEYLAPTLPENPPLQPAQVNKRLETLETLFQRLRQEINSTEET